MKIRFLLHDVFCPGGGVLTVTLALARGLAERHDVELVSLARHRVKPVRRLPDGVPVTVLVDESRRARRFGDRSWAQSLLQSSLGHTSSRLTAPEDPRHRVQSLYTDLQLIRYVRSVHDGVMIGMQPSINAAIARFGRQSVVRIAQDHRPLESRPERMQRASLRHYPKLDAFLTLTEHDAARYREQFGGSAPVRVIPNAAPDVSRAPSTQENRLVIAAGRLSRSKGFDLLLDAWVSVAKRHPGWELRIYGRGGERDTLQDQIDTLGVGETVRLMGYSRRLMEEMADASVFVLSSRFEGYPMVLLEAMSRGLPAVSFDCATGPREIITSGRDGLLVPNGDVDALADAITQMIDLGDDRRAMSRAALATARERSEEAVTAQWEQLLQDLLARKGGAS